MAGLLKLHDVHGRVAHAMHPLPHGIRQIERSIPLVATVRVCSSNMAPWQVGANYTPSFVRQIRVTQLGFCLGMGQT